MKNNKPIDIILVTCNRINFLKQTIQKMEERLSTPYRLIIINNHSIDGTTEYLEELKKTASYEIILVNNTIENVPKLSGCYTQGLEYVESEYFVCTQDDIIIPLHNPDVLTQLIDLIDRHPRYAAISLRKPYFKAADGKFTPEVTRTRTIGAGFRIHRTDEWKKIGGFLNRRWESLATKGQANAMGKVVGVCTDLWMGDLGFCHNRGYSQEYIDSVKDTSGWEWVKEQSQEFRRNKVLPEADPWTNIPLFLGNNVLGVKENNKSCGSLFRIQSKADVEKIGFGISQYERPFWSKQMNEVLNKKVGVVPKESGVYASEFKNVDKNRGYDEGIDHFHKNICNQ